jgi:hypothetical protein
MCDKILAMLGIVVYAAMAYNMQANYFLLPTPDLIASTAKPVEYVLHQLHRRFGTRTVQDIDSTIREFFQERIPLDADHIVNETLAKTVLFMMQSHIYSSFLERTIACILYAMGMESCRERCNQPMTAKNAAAMQMILR